MCFAKTETGVCFADVCVLVPFDLFLFYVMDHAKSLMPPSTPSMMNMPPTTEKGSRFVGICMHMCTQVVLRMYASPSMMCQPCAGALWEQSVHGPSVLGPILLDGARHLPILQRICMFAKLAENQCTQPSCTLVLHDICQLLP